MDGTKFLQKNTFEVSRPKQARVSVNNEVF